VPAVLAFCLPDVNAYVNHHLDIEKLRVFLVLGTIGGMLTALVVQAVIIRAGFWTTRKLTDQEADYEDPPLFP
jgi:hypothetical protein